MGIRQTIPTEDIKRQILVEVERRKAAMLYNLAVCGEKIINEARSRGDYTDRTGNLRSSIGALIICDGEVVQQNGFNVVKDGNEGAEEGKQFAHQIMERYPKGVVLIVVAGKNYASYVSAKGKDVLDSAELLADKIVPAMLKELGF